jgi:hypothetical protein
MISIFYIADGIRRYLLSLYLFKYHTNLHLSAGIITFSKVKLKTCQVINNSCF